MTKFRPCIDLHDGRVKQIVGGTLLDEGPGPKENFVADLSAQHYANQYRQDSLTGGHVIKLGPGNEIAARDALAAFPGGLQIGGGVDVANAMEWIEAGASHVIVTSWLFDSKGRLCFERLDQLVSKVGKQRIVLDLSCRQQRTKEGPTRWCVAMNRWQTLTEVEITTDWLDRLASYADEFLIHAADVEGLCQGIDVALVERMGGWGKLPMTYAGGVASMRDLQLIQDASDGLVDVTVGSSLDLFGGEGVAYRDLIQWNEVQAV